MATHLIVYKPPVGSRDRLQQFLVGVNRQGSLAGWSATGRVAPGDFALFYWGHPQQAVVAVGTVASTPRKQAGRYDWTRRRRVPFCDFKDVRVLDEPLRLADLSSTPSLQRWWRGRPYRNSRLLTRTIASKLMAEVLRLNPQLARVVAVRQPGQAADRSGRASGPSPGEYEEGALRELKACVRARSRELRAAAVATYGYSCAVCKFSFSHVYGRLGDGYIEIHHIQPLAETPKPRTSKVKDVVALCSNCHRMIHRRKPRALLPRQLKSLVRAAGRGRR